MKVLKNEPLKKHTSFRVGGPAKVYVIPEDDYELRKLIEFLYEEKLPYKIIGNGAPLKSLSSSRFCCFLARSVRLS